jgi:hypothetical protein
VSFSCLVLFHFFFAFQFLRKTQQAEADEEKEEKAHLARQAEKAAQFERYMAAENRAFASRKVDRVQTVAELKVIRNARLQRVAHAQNSKQARLAQQRSLNVTPEQKTRVSVFVSESTGIFSVSVVVLCGFDSLLTLHSLPTFHRVQTLMSFLLSFLLSFTSSFLLLFPT